MSNEIDTLATTLYVTIDDLVKTRPIWRPARPQIGFTPQLTDAELVSLARMQALLGYPDERRWIRYARRHLRHLFRYLPQ